MKQGLLLPQGPMRIRNFPRSQDRKVSELGHKVGSGMVSFPLLGLLRALNETCENPRHDHSPVIECILRLSRDFKLGGDGGGQRNPVVKVHKAGRCRAAKFLPLIYGAALCSVLRAWCWLKQSPVRPRPSPPIVSQEPCSPFSGGTPDPLTLQRSTCTELLLPGIRSSHRSGTGGFPNWVHLCFLCRCADTWRAGTSPVSSQERWELARARVVLAKTPRNSSWLSA